jgi:hypothetical protein
METDRTNKSISKTTQKTKRRRPRRRRSVRALARKIENVVLRERSVAIPQLRELLRPEVFDGDERLCDGHDTNIVYWTYVSRKLCCAFILLTREERIELRVVSPGLHALGSGFAFLPLLFEAPGSARRREAALQRLSRDRDRAPR